MIKTSHIELSKSALRQNIRFLRKQIGDQTIFSSVIKGNAYGHGIEIFLPMAEQCGIRHFAVFSANEALTALQSRTCEDTHIMIMGEIDHNDLEWAIENDISFYIFDIDRLLNSLQAAKKVMKPARIHIELETGMNRTGLESNDLQQVVDIIKKNRPAFCIEGVCTHYAGAESSSNRYRILNQYNLFKQQCKWLTVQGIKNKLQHTCCSAAALVYPESIMDMVRFGIAQYGFWPTVETKMHYWLQKNPQKTTRMTDPLRRVMRWCSRVMTIKNIKAGEFIGYGNAYITTRAQKIAMIPVGYYHGFSRNLSNLGHVLINGRRCQVIGTINMNMFIADVTDLPHVQKGDEVVIIGKQRKMNITVSSFSDLSNFLNYEVLVRLPAEIPREIVP